MYRLKEEDTDDSDACYFYGTHKRMQTNVAILTLTL